MQVALIKNNEVCALLVRARSITAPPHCHASPAQGKPDIDAANRRPTHLKAAELLTRSFLSASLSQALTARVSGALSICQIRLCHQQLFSSASQLTAMCLHVFSSFVLGRRQVLITRPVSRHLSFEGRQAISGRAAINACTLRFPGQTAIFVCKTPKR